MMKGRWTTCKACPGLDQNRRRAFCCLPLAVRSFPVDTHIHRVASRLELVTDNATPEKTQAKIQSLVPPNLSTVST